MPAKKRPVSRAARTRPSRPVPRRAARPAPKAAPAATNHRDVLVLGTGHNGLVLQAYLARAGLRTLAFDRALEPGGGLRTLENPRFPGFLHHPHSFFHRAITLMPWFRDLELARHGVRYIEPDFNVAMLLRDGGSIEWWKSLDQTVDSFSRLSKKDGASLRYWVEEFRPIVENILIPESRCPPLPPAVRREKLMRSKLGRRLLEVQALSPLEFVTRNFEHDSIRAGMLFFNGLREIDLRLPGFGHALPALLALPARAQMSVGGSGRVARGLVHDIIEHGGEIRTGAPIKRILLRGKRAAGVELASGERFTADVVVSDLNPHQTFLDLLAPDQVPAELRARVAGFKYNLLAPLFSLNLCLRELPRYAAAEKRPELNDAFMFILGLDRFSQFGDIVTAHERGELPAPVMWGTTPSQFDPTQAPAGCHTAFMWEKLPYALRGDPRNWDSYREERGRTLLSLWNSYAPNIESNVIDCFTRSPLDIERGLPNMAQGDLLVGAFDHGQIGANRPFPGAGNYRTPIPGLYLCGGCTHPGGNVTGLCGYNSARTILADAGKKLWWTPPDIEASLEAAEKLG